jgi:hypothetical protein
MSAPPASQKKKKKKRKGPFKIHRYGGWLLYFWHGMRFSAWVALLRRGKFDITLNCLPNILTVTIWAPVNSLLYYISEALYGRRADARELEPPVFILGHWRTGTTLLHDLMSCDRQLAAPTTYECFFPNHFLLSERAIGRVFNVFLPKKRPQDDVPVAMDRPQEDEFALSILGLGTPYNSLAFPRHGPVDQDYLDMEGLDEPARARWRDGFLWFCRRLALKHGRRLLLKSPPHTARLKLLLKLFPNARFIHISRDPHAVVPSTIKLWRALYSTQGLHNPPQLDPWLEDHVFDTFQRMDRAYEAGRALIPEGHLVEIRMEDFIADPRGVIESVYARLDLQGFAEAAPAFDAFLGARGIHAGGAYALTPEMESRIADQLAPYMARFGYEPRG